MLRLHVHPVLLQIIGCLALRPSISLFPCPSITLLALRARLLAVRDRELGRQADGLIACVADALEAEFRSILDRRR